MHSETQPFQDAIQRVLPHRYPFLLVDRVTEFIPGVRICGVKRISATESAVMGYRPDAPETPGVILVEAVTQLGAILVLQQPEMAGKIAMIIQVPSAHTRRPAVPGDSVVLEAQVLRMRATTGELQGRILLDGELIGDGQMRFAIADAASLQLSG